MDTYTPPTHLMEFGRIVGPIDIETPPQSAAGLQDMANHAARAADWLEGRAQSVPDSPEFDDEAAALWRASHFWQAQSDVLLAMAYQITHRVLLASAFEAIRPRED